MYCTVVLPVRWWWLLSYCGEYNSISCKEYKIYINSMYLAKDTPMFQKYFDDFFFQILWNIIIVFNKYYDF